ncbi:MAG TPA: hypothetical protein VIS07_13975 [Candidatus Binatia bacterium]
MNPLKTAPWRAARRHGRVAVGDVRVRPSRPKSTTPRVRPLVARERAYGWTTEQYREACRLLPGFELLPVAMVAAFASHAIYFDAAGPLRAEDRDEIAHAITRRRYPGFGSPDDGLPRDGERRVLVRRLAERALEPFASLEPEVSALLDAGVPAREVRVIVHALLALRFLATLGAAMLLQPPLDADIG